MNTEIVQFNVTDSRINELSNEYMQLEVVSINDIQGLKNVYAARQIVKGLRVDVEKKRKELVEDAVKYQKTVNGEAKRITCLLEPIETHLQSEEDKIASEKQRIKDEIELAERERVQARIDKLLAYGFSIDYNEVKNASNDDFEYRLNEAKTHHELEVAAKEEEKRLADLAAEKLEAERKELELLRRQQAEAQRIIDENNARIAKEQTEKERAIVEEQERIKSQNLAIEQEKKRIEVERLRAIELEQAKKEATETARLKAIEDARIEAAQKLEADTLQKIEDERQAALRPDKEKLQAFADKLVELKPPTVNDEKAIAICEGLQELINKTHTYLLNKIKSL